MLFCDSVGPHGFILSQIFILILFTHESNTLFLVYNFTSTQKAYYILLKIEDYLLFLHTNLLYTKELNETPSLMIHDVEVPPSHSSTIIDYKAFAHLIGAVALQLLSELNPNI